MGRGCHFGRNGLIYIFNIIFLFFWFVFCCVFLSNLFIYLFILFIYFLIGRDRPRYTSHPTAVFNDYYMRHSKNSALADVLKTEQSHHREKIRDLKDEDMEIKEDSTNNEDQLLNKVIPLETHVVIDSGALLRQIFRSGTAF